MRWLNRLKWDSIAPLGMPVVPDVYWITARSCTARPWGGDAASRGASSSFSQLIVPGAGWVSRSRVSRSFFTGRCRASRFTVGKALSRFTATMRCSGTSSGRAFSLGTATSQQIATRAAWSSKMCRSSRSV